MIKLTGPSELKHLSLGKLCSFVQNALNQNLLIYYKTLLIKNNQLEVTSSIGSTELKNCKKVETMKEQILSLLKEHRNGLSLAQIPLLLKNKYKKTYNIQSLGFPKLKNLLVTMEEIDLEKTQGNLLKAVLRTHYRKNSEKPLEEHPKSNLGGKKFLTLNPKPLDNRLNNAHYNSALASQMYSQHSGLHSKGCRTVSNLDDYIFKIQSTVIDILKQNPFGIEVEKLEAELARRLGTNFQYKIFKVDSFQEFLVHYLGDYLDIEIKKSLKKTMNAGPLSHIVYPKNYKLPNPPKTVHPLEDSPDSHMFEKISNMSPSSFQPFHPQSPDMSLHFLPPVYMETDINREDELYLGESHSINMVRSMDGNFPGETLSHNAGSTGAEFEPQPAYSAKSTRQNFQYSYFGKLNAVKSQKVYGAEFKIANMKTRDTHRLKPKHSPRDDGSREPVVNPQPPGTPLSFDKAPGIFQGSGDSGIKQGHQLSVSKSTEHNEDVSNDPSVKLVDKLLEDE